MSEEQPSSENIAEECQKDLEEGAGHIKFGVGVGAVSAASLLLIGTTCPLCYFVAPAMVAAGIHKRHKAKKKLQESGEPDLTINWPETV